MKSKKKAIVDLAGETYDISFQSPISVAGQAIDNLKAFGLYRSDNKKTLSRKDKLMLDLVALKYKIFNFLNSEMSSFRFGTFLAVYMKSLEINGRSFANEIKISQSELSQILHNHRDPNQKFMLRLEIHSNYNFPASMWYEVLAKQKALELKNDSQLKREQESYVKPAMNLVI